MARLREALELGVGVALGQGIGHCGVDHSVFSTGNDEHGDG